eukprot:scaffold10199_cov146-Cylindrotheca_fusiformis.AAC.36
MILVSMAGNHTTLGRIGNGMIIGSKSESSSRILLYGSHIVDVSNPNARKLHNPMVRKVVRLGFATFLLHSDL